MGSRWMLRIAALDGLSVGEGQAGIEPAMPVVLTPVACHLPTAPSCFQPRNGRRVGGINPDSAGLVCLGSELG